MAFSAVFLVQLLVSSFCFITPASAAQPAVSEHCHEEMSAMHGPMHSKTPMAGHSHHNSGKGCAHCDAPQNLNTVSITSDLTPAAVLLAIVAPFAEIPTAVSADLLSIEKAQAPPDSSGILLTTSQRIRI